jgi:hypothetical protein
MKLRKFTSLAALIGGAAIIGWTVPATAASYTPASYTPTLGSIDGVLRATYLVRGDFLNYNTGRMTSKQLDHDVAVWYTNLTDFGAPFSNAKANFVKMLKPSCRMSNWFNGLIAQEVHYVETGNT